MAAAWRLVIRRHVWSPCTGAGLTDILTRTCRSQSCRLWILDVFLIPGVFRIWCMPRIPSVWCMPRTTGSQCGATSRLVYMCRRAAVAGGCGGSWCVARRNGTHELECWTAPWQFPRDGPSLCPADGGAWRRHRYSTGRCVAVWLYSYDFLLETSVCAHDSFKRWIVCSGFRAVDCVPMGLSLGPSLATRPWLQRMVCDWSGWSCIGLDGVLFREARGRVSVALIKKK